MKPDGCGSYVGQVIKFKPTSTTMAKRMAAKHFKDLPWDVLKTRKLLNSAALVVYSKNKDGTTKTYGIEMIQRRNVKTHLTDTTVWEIPQWLGQMFNNRLKQQWRQGRNELRKELGRLHQFE